MSASPSMATTPASTRSRRSWPRTLSLVAVLHIFFTVTFRDGFHFWSTLGYLFLVAVYGLLVIFSFNTGTKPEPVSGPVSEEVDEFAAATAMPMPNPKVAKQNPKELV